MRTPSSDEIAGRPLIQYVLPVINKDDGLDRINSLANQYDLLITAMQASCKLRQNLRYFDKDGARRTCISNGGLRLE